MNTLAPSFLIRSFSFLQVKRTYIKAWISSNFNQIPPPDSWVICPCAVWKIGVNTLAPAFLIGSFSFFQVMRTTSKSGQSSNFGQIGPRDAELQPLIIVRNWFWLNILRMDGQNLTKFCIHMIIDKTYVATVRRHFSQICNGVTALDWCQKLVFAQYLENGWTEFNQILYTYDHWQDLYWYCKASFLANVQQSNGP